MNNGCSPSIDLGDDALNLLAKAGTIGLPYPPPASGLVYMGINSRYRDDLPWASPQYYLRVVQTQSPRQVITRIVDLQELRGISLPTVDLRLMFLDCVADLPTTGRNLAIVARSGDLLYFRIFDSHGGCAVDTDENRCLEAVEDSTQRDELVKMIGELKELLTSLRAPRVLTNSDMNRVLTLMTAIVDYTYLPAKDKESGGARVFLTTNQIARDLLSAADRLSAAQRDGTGMTERLLYPDAVIYVSEQAPVYVQLKSEFGVTAAEAAENVSYFDRDDPCPCPLLPGNF